MDSRDIRILELLQDNAGYSAAEISRRVHLSSSACWHRIEKLEHAGVIAKRVAILDPAALGLSICAFVEIQAGDHSPEWHSQFSDAISAMPEVTELHRTTGQFDYLLRVWVRTIGEYDRFYSRLVATVAAKNVTARFSIQRVKSTTAFPLYGSARCAAGVAD